jgi:hypothetical protein
LRRLKRQVKTGATKMNEESEDMTESRPVGFDRPVDVDDPKRPGVRLSELRRGPMGVL